MTDTKSSLPIYLFKRAKQTALENIREAANTTQNGLLCRWSSVNRQLLGAWQFGNYYLLAGMSGSGKSYILNMLYRDFCNQELNRAYTRKFRILHFCFEMSAADEIIRMLSSTTGMSYAELMSAEAKLTPEQITAIEESSALLDNDILHYVEISGNRNQIMATVEKFNNRYPEDQLIISIDHGILAEYQDESNEVELMSKLSKTLIDIRKRYGAMIILIGQLNAEIENTDRIAPPRNKMYLQYPTKKDIHSSKAVYRDADYVTVIHAPELLNITEYGPNLYETQDKVFWHFLKKRKGAPLLNPLKFAKEFHIGNMREINVM
jgi:replicative DNA helicase